MKKVVLLPLLSVLLIITSSCGVAPTTNPPVFPTVPPDIDIPASFELTGLETRISDRQYLLESSIEGYLFENSQVQVDGDDIEIKNSMFINSQVFVNNRSNVSFQSSIFKELNIYEQTTLMIYKSDNIMVNNCQFTDNYIGLGIHESSAEVTGSRFENNNGHNALVIGEGSSARVAGNYFYGSFPHAILIMNREAHPNAGVEITGNVIEFTGQDAIDFEDYRNASPSLVTHNVIKNTGWSAITVEYNSWEADITISDNWIEATGIEWTLPLHPLQPEEYQPGWGHGIFIEDSSLVSVERNRITLAGENGIEIRNGREVTLESNGIDCAQIALAVYEYNTSSLGRPFSPLSPEDAGGSRVTAIDNVIYQASREYEVDENSELVLE
jgi:hypothetical protein